MTGLLYHFIFYVLYHVNVKQDVAKDVNAEKQDCIAHPCAHHVLDRLVQIHVLLIARIMITDFNVVNSNFLMGSLICIWVLLYYGGVSSVAPPGTTVLGLQVQEYMYTEQIIFRPQKFFIIMVVLNTHIVYSILFAVQS